MYVDPKRNQQAGNLKWILPYCKPDLPRVAGAVVLFCVNNTMALIIPLLSGLIVDRVITQGHVDELTRLCVMMIVFTVVRVASRYGYQMWMERGGDVFLDSPTRRRTPLWRYTARNNATARSIFTNGTISVPRQ